MSRKKVQHLPSLRADEFSRWGLDTETLALLSAEERLRLVKGRESLPLVLFDASAEGQAQWERNAWDAAFIQAISEPSMSLFRKLMVLGALMQLGQRGLVLAKALSFARASRFKACEEESDFRVFEGGNPNVGSPVACPSFIGVAVWREGKQVRRPFGPPTRGYQFVLEPYAVWVVASDVRGKEEARLRRLLWKSDASSEALYLDGLSQEAHPA